MRKTVTNFVCFKGKKMITYFMCLMLALSLTACGSKNGAAGEKGGRTAADQGQDSEAKTTDNSGSLEKITMVLDWTPNTNHTGLYVAQAKGYFEEAGLLVELIQPPEDGADVLVAGGGAQFGVGFQEYLAPAFSSENPLPITAVAAVIQHNTSGYISLKENGIETPKDMCGHTYATWDLDVEKAILKYIIEKDGGRYEDLNMIPSTVADLVSALKTDVDLVWIYYAWDGIAAKAKGLETNYINLADLDEALDFYSPVITANNEYLKNNPGQVKKFLGAVKKGYEYAMEHPEESAEILCEAAPELDKEIVTESQKWLADKYQAEAESWGIIDPKRWDGFYGWLFDQGVIREKIPEGTGFTNEYLN